MDKFLSRRFFLKAVPGVFLVPAWLTSAEVLSPAAFQVRATPLFMRQGSKLKQMLSATIKDADYQDGFVEVSAGGRAARIQLWNAHRSGTRVLLPVEPPEQETSFQCVYRDAVRNHETLISVQPERHWTIYVVHGSHHDLGYDALPSEMRAGFVRVLDEAVRCCKETRARPPEARFKWNIEVSFLLEDYRKARSAEAFREVMDLVKAGSMEAGALYANLQTDLLAVEPLCRSVRYTTSTLAKEFDLNVQTAILDDVPGFTWGLAEVLARSGIRYFVFGGNQTRSNLLIDTIPILFYWEGPAGGKVMLWRSARYDEGMFLTSRGGNKVDLSQPDDLATSMLQRYSRGDYPYDAILLQAAGDNIHPYPELMDHVEHWNTVWEFPRLRLATASEFFRYVEEKYAERIPILRGGYPDAWVDLRGSMANEVALARRIENELPDAEKWATLAGLSGDRDRSGKLTAAYDNLLLFEEHTMGWHAGKEDIYLDESQGGGKKHYLEKIAFLNEAAATADNVRASSLSFLSRNVSAGKSPRFLVWNPLSWNRTGLVRAPLPELSSFALRELGGGPFIPHQIVKTTVGPEVIFVARQVPSTGYRSFELDSSISQTKLDEFRITDLELESPYYHVRLNPHSGAVASLTDKDTGKELVDADAPHGFNQLLYVLSKEITHRDFRDIAEMRPRAVHITRGFEGPVCASLKSTGAIEDILTLEQEVILYAELKRVDLITRLHKKPVYVKEGVYIAFPFAVAGSRRYGKFHVPVKIDVPGGFMRPDVDQLGGSSHDYYVPQHGVFLEDRDKAVFWTAADAPIVEFGRIQSNRWNAKLVGDDNWLAHPWLYSYLMNNYWYTNAPIAQDGQFTFRYSFTSRAPGGELTRDKQFGWETLSPMSTILLPPGDSGAWAEHGSLASAEPTNTALAAIKKAGDGKGIILRLVEVAGLSTEAFVSVTTPGRRVRKALICDLNENVLSPAHVDGGRIKVRLAPFEMSTVRVLLG